MIIALMEGIDLITLLLLWLPLPIYGKFTVTGPAHPVIAIVGEDVTLECQVMPSLPINNMVVRWLKADLGSAVYMYRNGEDDAATQDPEYRGRTELFKNDLTKGNISLKIKNTRVFDEGKYRCSVDDETEFEETVVELKVGGLGRNHWIQIEGNNKQGIQLICESNGWFPKPKLMWTNADGQNLTAQSEINYHRDTQGLLTVKSSVTVTKDSTNSFKCLIQNNLLKKEQEATIQIADDFFPAVSGWLVFLCLILGLFIIVLITGIVWTVRKHRCIKELECDKSIKQYDQWKSLIESDWAKISEYKVNVTLDTKTANPTLEISKDQKNVRLIRKERNVRDNEERLLSWESVLGSEEFTSGSHYWEVEVVGNRQWNVGVAMESVERKEDIHLVPSGKVWTIGRADNQFQANSEEKFDIPVYEIPKKIGVYLSYDSGIVSFYSANTKSHLYSFTGFKFTEKLHPFVSTAHCNKWLRIWSVQD
ncbi:butyrophilin subfamily 1 member A1-like [Chiloscyllium plagiosum]|uniref:butyrophilin subfamily 1 member A1-like n=1 Tax=Chiloscyllium plagiosum TaxID=36176 RepID=UPI001CB85A5E|nr:butyrophilin subfamily 1 member A1-like [Chiloscyllium plagiosum]XP_043534139.1 butyrophilin subfamily 1 member A1-like [Chiloscyllium plagiosum]XP_043534140.1 butyrophilin subfamily 1 member A1-like [Chiloscyllium plagiosum]XP_043534141.1 butyrophilin subfamily 1 member A1-like [Chiloscyllium plagiosum]